MPRLLSGIVIGIVAGSLLTVLLRHESEVVPSVEPADGGGAPATDTTNRPPATAQDGTAISDLRDQLAAERTRNQVLVSKLRELKAISVRDATAQSELIAPRQWLQDLMRKKFGDLTTAQLQHMRELDLSESDLIVHDLAHLARLPALRWLTLRRTKTDDDGLIYLLRAPSLVRLGLRETKVTDAGMPTIGTMRRLEHLDLNMLPITDAGLAQIRTLTALKFLRLNFTHVTNAGMKHIAQLRNLRRLDLWGTKVTDAGLDEIWHLPHLEHLELGATAVSKSWVDRYRRDHAGCYVHSRFGK